MRTKNILGLLMCIALVFSLSFAQPASAASAEDEVLQVMTNFLKAFNTHDFELMSSLWWHSPKLLRFGPDKSGALLEEGWDGIEESFKSYFNLPIGTWSESLRHPEVMMLGDNVAIISSYVVETVNPPAVKEQTTFLIRGTLVVQKIDGKWLIVYEHSSMLPTE